MPCCQITGIDARTTLAKAKVNASGQSFQFKPSNSVCAAAMRVGGPVYANFNTRQISLDGRTICGAITSMAPSAAAKLAPALPTVNATPPVGAVPAQTQPTPAPATPPAGNAGTATKSAPVPPANPPTPCCDITGINAQTGMVTARVNATGQTFQFQTSPQLLQSLKVGQRVYANFTAKRASLDGKSACCVIIDLPRLIGPAAGSKPPSGSSLGSSIKTPVDGGGTSQACTATCPVAVPCPVGAVSCIFSASSAVCETACTTMAKCNAGYTLVRTTSCNVFSTQATCQRACPPVSTGQPAECASGYYGEMCAQQCPGGATNKCSGHGSCNEGITGTGQCNCNPGFNGASCQFSDAVTCSGHGTTDYSGHCTCSAGYSGNSCNVEN